MRLVISTLGEITQQANSLLSRSFGRRRAGDEGYSMRFLPMVKMTACFKRLLQKILELRSNEHAIQFPICIGTGSVGTWEFV